MQIGNIEIVRSRDIKKKLIDGFLKEFNHSKPKEWGWTLGIYNSRIFGLCIYRLKENKLGK